MFAETRIWLREQMVLRKARLLLQRRGLPLVCYAMFRLNRHAQTLYRENPAKDRIYALKNHLVRHLYESGYCVSAKLHVQNFPCWGYDREGCDGCERCNYTGIYRSIRLYSFRFQVGDRSFSWHQPQGLVTWNVALTDDAATAYETKFNKNIVSVRGDRLRLLVALVYVYLESVGIGDALPHYRLKQSLYNDVIANPQQLLRYRRQLWSYAWLDVIAYARNPMRLVCARLGHKSEREDARTYVCKRCGETWEVDDEDYADSQYGSERSFDEREVLDTEELPF